MRSTIEANRRTIALGVIAGTCLVVMSLAIVWRAHDQAVLERQVAENAKTAQALCDAAGGARDFWIQVRSTTREVLRDPGLSPTMRDSNERYVRALTKVIMAADGVAHRCDSH